MTTPERADSLAAALYDARLARVPIPPLTEADPTSRWPTGTPSSRASCRYLDAGDRIIGYKLGLTSKPMQQMLNVPADFAPVMASHVITDGAAVAISDYIAPRLEAEIALVLGADLEGPDCTALDVLRATEGAVASIELVDSRVRRLEDQAGRHRGGHGERLDHRPRPRRTDRRPRPAHDRHGFTRDGEVIATGAGAAALGNPPRAVAFLVRTLHGLGDSLKAGSIVMTGRCTPPSPSRWARPTAPSSTGSVRSPSDRLEGTTRGTPPSPSSAPATSGPTSTQARAVRPARPRRRHRHRPQERRPRPCRPRAATRPRTPASTGCREPRRRQAPVFDATSAYVHRKHDEVLSELGIIGVDLTPAAIGPKVIPSVNLTEHLDQRNVNMVTCGGQATTPMVYAVRRAIDHLPYAEMVSTVSSKSAGPAPAEHRRVHPDDAKALGRSAAPRAARPSSSLNPPSRRSFMRNTVFAACPEAATTTRSSTRPRRDGSRSRSSCPATASRTGP